jgi:methionyl-tRNA formyltransferase
MKILQKIRTIYNSVFTRTFHVSPLGFTKPDLKVVFFGTDLLSIKILNSLVQLLKSNRIKELNVVTSSFSLKPGEAALQVDDSSNSTIRGNKVVNFCRQHNVPYTLWPTVSDPKQFKARFESHHVGVVASFGHLIPSEIIQQFPQ